MPLMAKLPQAVTEHPVKVQLEPDHHEADQVLEEIQGAEKDLGYKDFDAAEEDLEDHDMENSLFHRPRPRKAPAIPPRSDARASKILDSVLLEWQTLGATVPSKDAEELSIISDPLESYLSSEEDASLSDFEDSDSIDFTLTEDGADSPPSSRASSRHSQEDTARMVSFTVVSKPQIIQIRIAAPTLHKRHSTNLDNLTAPMKNLSTSYISPHSNHRPTPLKLYPSSVRRLSISSPKNRLSYHPNTSLSSLPIRKSSKANLSTLNLTKKNSFLASDPFASPSHPQPYEHETEPEAPLMPKTPTSTAASALKRTLSRSLSLSRKPSVPTLNATHAAGAARQRDSLVLARELAAEEREAKERRMLQRAEISPRSMQGEKARYQDVMWAAIEVNGAPLPPSEGRQREKERKAGKGHKMSLSIGMGLGRKKSVKSKG